MNRGGISFGRWNIPETELEERFDTSGGPGGQHANRNETVVTLRVDLEATSLPSELVDRMRDRLGRSVIAVTAGETRSQWRNRALARDQLARILEEAARPTRVRRRTKPTRAAAQRRLEEKRRRSELKKSRRSRDW